MLEQRIRRANFAGQGQVEAAVKAFQNFVLARLRNEQFSRWPTSTSEPAEPREEFNDIVGTSRVVEWAPTRLINLGGHSGM